MQPFPSMLVFCDLDDTLFDSRTFSVDASTRRALARLEREHLPLVFSSSKTRAELELIQYELGISQPFICENGGAVFVPRGYFGFNVTPVLDVAGYEVVQFGKPYTEVVASLRRAADRLDIAVVGFHDMSVEEVAIDCGLPLLHARLAKLREYNELFRVVDAKPGALPRLFKALRGAGLDCTCRGAFHHLGSVRQDLGVQFLRGLYRRAFGDVVTVAFGDHRGAVPLLQQVDVPLVVPTSTSDETTHLMAAVPAARLSVPASLNAWAEVILDLADAGQRIQSSCSS